MSSLSLSLSLSLFSSLSLSLSLMRCKQPGQEHGEKCFMGEGGCQPPASWLYSSSCSGCSWGWWGWGSSICCCSLAFFSSTPSLVEDVFSSSFPGDSLALFLGAWTCSCIPPCSWIGTFSFLLVWSEAPLLFLFLALIHLLAPRICGVFGVGDQPPAFWPPLLLWPLPFLGSEALFLTYDIPHYLWVFKVSGVSEVSGVYGQCIMIPTFQLVPILVPEPDEDKLLVLVIIPDVENFPVPVPGPKT